MTNTRGRLKRVNFIKVKIRGITKRSRSGRGRTRKLRVEVKRIAIKVYRERK
jgi:hypothetical protein